MENCVAPEEKNLLIFLGQRKTYFSNHHVCQISLLMFELSSLSSGQSYLKNTFSTRIAKT